MIQAFFQYRITVLGVDTHRCLRLSPYGALPPFSPFPTVLNEISSAPDRVVVVPLGVNSSFRPLDQAVAREVIQRKYGVADPFVLFVGALEPRKNVPTLLQAFDKYRQMYPRSTYRLVIVGRQGSAWPEIQRTVEYLSLTPDVVFLGHVPGEDLPLLYNAAELFAFPSMYEGFGLPVLEAMACGTPVLTTNVSSLPEVAGDAAILVDPTDGDALAMAMGQVLNDASLREGLSERGVERAQAFSWQRAAQSTLSVYEQVARDRR